MFKDENCKYMLRIKCLIELLNYRFCSSKMGLLSVCKPNALHYEHDASSQSPSSQLRFEVRLLTVSLFFYFSSLTPKILILSWLRFDKIDAISNLSYFVALSFALTVRETILEIETNFFAEGRRSSGSVTNVTMRRELFRQCEIELKNNILRGVIDSRHSLHSPQGVQLVTA